jgi:hypothetical protein
MGVARAHQVLLFRHHCRCQNTISASFGLFSEPLYAVNGFHSNFWYEKYAGI